MTSLQHEIASGKSVQETMTSLKLVKFSTQGDNIESCSLSLTTCTCHHCNLMKVGNFLRSKTYMAGFGLIPWLVPLAAHRALELHVSSTYWWTAARLPRPGEILSDTCPALTSAQDMLRSYVQ
jgi:hypothetical protein